PRVDFPFEVIAVDSSSTDGTADLLLSRVDRLISVAADAFDHGLTRNLGIEQACGELVVLLVQESAAGSEFLAGCADRAAFRRSPAGGGVLPATAAAGPSIHSGRRRSAKTSNGRERCCWRGYRLAYVPAAEVIHSHDRSSCY